MDRQADDACEMAIRVNDRPSLEKEARFLTGVDKNCSCPKGVFVDVVIGDSLSAVKAKVCHLPMPMQKLPTLRILSPLQDMAAYPAMEVDRHMHGRLSHALGHGGDARVVELEPLRPADGAHVGHVVAAAEVAHMREHSEQLVVRRRFS